MNVTKGVITGELENVILKPLADTFNETWRLKRESIIDDEANNQAHQNGTDYDEEKKKATKKIEALGEPYFFFEESTDPAFKQSRSSMIKVPWGALNYIVDEMFGVDAANSEVMESMIKTYDVGGLKQKLIKHSSDNPRMVDGPGTVPTNMLLFGTGTHLDDPIVHRDFIRRCESGLARRSFFAFSRHADKRIIDPVEKLKLLESSSTASHTKVFLDAIRAIIHPTQEGRQFFMQRDTNLYLLAYQNDCEARAKGIKDKVMKAEMTHRYMKVTKLAAAYAAWDDSPTNEVTLLHLQAAIKVAEDGDEHMERIVQSVPLHARLAEYLAGYDGELTMAQLVANLPWFKGTINVREEMLQLASEYGYSNSIIINQEKRNGITFLSGEGIVPTDLNKMTIAYSNHEAYNYTNGRGPFDRLPQIVGDQGRHWITHHVEEGHRCGENVISGFNMIVLDVDNDNPAEYTPLAAAELLLEDYSYIIYESKRSTPTHNRYRIIMPISHVLSLPEDVYAKFMANIFDWLPINLDTGTNQRCRKWLGNDKGVKVHKGKLLPALDFIPDTAAATKIHKQSIAMGDVNQMEKWFIRSIEGGEHRNNTLFKYGAMIVDAGGSHEATEQAVLDLNSKLANPLPESRIRSTIFVSIAKKIAERINQED